MNFPLEVILTTKDEGRLGEQNKGEGKIKISARCNGRTNFLICKTTAVGCHLLLVYSRDQNPRVKTINHPAIWLNEWRRAVDRFVKFFFTND